jgi:hypothetical protein
LVGRDQQRQLVALPSCVLERRDEYAKPAGGKVVLEHEDAADLAAAYPRQEGSRGRRPLHPRDHPLPDELAQGRTTGMYEGIGCLYRHRRQQSGDEQRSPQATPGSR